jgi:protein disulfide-isomerase
MDTTQAKQAKMQVEVWSDISCPFCYIGKRQYETAIKQFVGQEHIELIWKSFQLDPSIAVDEESGVTITQYLAKRKGLSVAQVEAMNKNVELMAKNAGLDYKLSSTKVFNSYKAHRLIQLAKSKGLGDEVEEALFQANFVHNKNLGQPEELIEIGRQIGLSEADVNEALGNEVYAEKVDHDLQEARQLGISGVPFFVFDRKYGVSGAQRVEVFLETLNKSFDDWKKENPLPKLEVTAGNVCTTDGKCD